MKKMISADEFQGLILNEKVQLIFSIGEELYSRLDKNYITKLYVINDFYVEVSYLAIDNKIKQIDVVTDKYLNENYLAEIDISDIFRKM